MPMMTMIAQNWVDVFAAGCVGVYAWERFSTPATWRSTTTRWQWNIALVGYVTAAIALWWIVRMVITTNPEAARFLMFGADPGAVGSTTADLVKASAPFAAALFLTALLPHLPLLKKLDAAFRMIFRELGAIPKRARQLSSKVRHAEFAVPVALVRPVSAELRSQQLDLETLCRAAPYSPAWNWLRIVTIKTRLCADLSENDLAEERDDGRAAERNSPFVECRLGEYKQMVASYRRLAALAGIVLAAPGSDPNPISDERREELLRTFEEEASELFRGLSHLVSCYMLSTKFGMRDAIDSLEEWGFRTVEEVRPPLIHWHSVVGLALLTIVYMFLLFRIMGAGGGQVDRALVIAVMIGINMAGAALLAGVPGLLTRRQGRAADGMNYGYYLLAAGLAALLWCLVYYLRSMAVDGLSFAEFVGKLDTRFPFMLIPAGAAFFIALLIDLDLHGRFKSEWSGRAVEGAVLAVALGATAYIAADLMRSLADGGGRFPDPTRIMAVQAGLGFMLGWIVPDLYRRVRERDETREIRDPREEPPMDEDKHTAFAW